ncbi:37S ribosomal protein S9, mitochondrial domain protein [Candida albicans]|uniref:Small ribosomal subunit protein uS9m n=1 Tax=Candida albicans TaxID=5476 RepID=A0A8H6BXX8_CANAX|nr:37S ribosomal protein S9, mitochondrial domain protein [Candida albicans]
MALRLITRFRGLNIPQRSLHQSNFRLNETIQSTTSTTTTTTTTTTSDEIPTTKPRFQSRFRRNQQPHQQQRSPYTSSQVTENLNIGEINRVRTVPTLMTYYGGNPVHEDNMNRLRAVLKKYQQLPVRVVPDREIQSQKFIGFDDYLEKTQSGTRVKKIHYRELITLLNRLRTIDLELMPLEVSEILSEYTSKSVSKITQLSREKTLDCFGRAKTQAKRKSSIAKIYLVKGEGEVLVNGKSLIEFFPNIYARKNLLYPFQVVEQEGKYNVFAQVTGGGYTGQSEAIMYAIAKALVVFNPLLKPRLSKAGLMKSDTRIVERKKPGKVKARKSPTWVKR